ncbi:uncharacterized protein LOC123562024 [Mercenaria mercenaria]|uniref:uncharacterized protein LOC123562024 n=1 Tax=Mercenaria mercenaria TaxID=6596 RepID=UPI00234F03A8|nr:uncharacterized protein LOC123562024 [Mercenaria mercenaria]
MNKEQKVLIRQHGNITQVCSHTCALDLVLSAGSVCTRQVEHKSSALVQSAEHVLLAPFSQVVHEEQQFGRQWQKARSLKRLKEDFKEDAVELKVWQRNLLHELEFQHSRKDTRTINWIYDQQGNNGKTWLTKYLVANRGAISFQNGKTCDIAYMYHDQEYVVFDLVRSSQEHINYEIIEMIKNGLMNSTKYRSKVKIFREPVVTVMSNTLPCIKKISKDRLNVKYIENDCLQVPELCYCTLCKKDD